MIQQWKLTIPSVPGHPLYADSAYRLYAFLLEQLPYEDACWLHEAGTGAVSQYLCCHREKNACIWTVNLLLSEVGLLLRPVLEQLSQVQIENQCFPVAEKSHREISAEALISEGRKQTQTRSTMVFCSPTAFRQSGRYTIFPQEKLILQSLISRWNEVFPEYPLEDADAFQALLSGIHIVDYQLKTSRFFLKGVKIPGFTGSCILDAKLPVPLLELWNTLLRFADYSGIGIKTGLGMGGISVR